VSGPIPYVVYASKSTQDDHESIQTQLATVAGAVGPDRFEFAGPFSEEKRSGFNHDRGPKLEAALMAAESAADQHGAAELWVWKSDRLARGSGKKDEARSLLEVFTRLKRKGVALRSVLDDAYVQDEVTIGMASKMANKYSEDLSAATRAGKQRQYDRGQRPGGPVPDGLRLKIERDDDDRVISRTYVPDHDGRGPVIERLFELSEEGHGDAKVAQKLNGEALRKKSGKPWDRRSVQAAVENQGYAARIVRTHDREVIEATNMVPLIDPDRYDRIIGARVLRDRARGDRRRRGGSQATKYVLGRLAICDRCGARLYARTETYKRKKDGQKRRYYRCANVVNQTGTCDQPRLDAELIDEAVVDYLDRLFVDFDAWRTETERARDSARDTVLAALKAAEVEVARLDKLVGKVQADYLKRLDAGEDNAAQFAVDAKARVEDERAAKQSEVEARRSALAEIEAPTDDTMLDVWNDLKRAVREGDEGTAALNERLRAEFAEFRLDCDDEQTVGILPVLLPRDVAPENPLLLLQAWKDADEPGPTEQAEADYDDATARETAEGLIVVPAKPLSATMGHKTHG
jgi:DNA invertase Pin-like site-specific DNA recombinase